MFLDVKNLRAGYEQNTEVLHDLNFQLAAGESLAIVGANGTGKSTLLNVLLGFVPFTGDVNIFDLPLVPANFAAIRGRLGMLFQNPDDQILQGRIADDIAFGPRNYGVPETEIASRTQKVLAQLGRPDLLDKVTYKVSFGEKKLAALAGLLVMQPELLLLDEPTSALDPRARKQFIETLQTLPVAKLIVSHDLDMVFHGAQKVLLLDHGTIAAAGTPAGILTNRELLEAHGLEMPLCMQRMEK